MRIRRQSTSGTSERNSTVTHATNRTTAATNRPTIRGDDQPQSAPSLTPSSRAISHPERSPAARKFTVPGVFTGDSGTKKNVATVAIAVITSGIQNSQW